MHQPRVVSRAEWLVARKEAFVFLRDGDQVFLTYSTYQPRFVEPFDP
jgi:hypothetical protein